MTGIEKQMLDIINLNDQKGLNDWEEKWIQKRTRYEKINDRQRRILESIYRKVVK